MSNDIWLEILDYFEDEKNALIWLQSPCLALGCVSPEIYLEQPNGNEKVFELLNKLKHGMTA